MENLWRKVGVVEVPVPRSGALSVFRVLWAAAWLVVEASRPHFGALSVLGIYVFYSIGVASGSDYHQKP